MPPSESFGENPAVLLDNQAKAGAKSTTTLEWQGEKAVLTFPIPDVPGAMATATLVNYLPESVVVTHGANKTEFIYGKWADWNNPLFKIEALYAGTIVERKNGTVVRSVTAKVTEIGQIYVIMPVPDSVQKAWKVRIAMNNAANHRARLLACTAAILAVIGFVPGRAGWVWTGRPRRRGSARRSGGGADAQAGQREA